MRCGHLGRHPAIGFHSRTVSCSTRVILASESVVAHLATRYEFGPRLVVDLKGKGPTQARFLLSREGTARRESPSVPRSTKVGAGP
jgi:hypothetical protein